ncbi:MAG: AAA family ATPase [Flavobacterium sp.]|nr:AAA family ATPase [Flavobacterium sp.]
MSEIENLHIKELRIDNYKSLKHSTIELQSGLNIIIGKNGAGKSNLLKFIDGYASRNIQALIPRVNRFFASNLYVSFQYLENKRVNTISYLIEKIRNIEQQVDIEYGSSYEVIFNKIEDGNRIVSDKKFIGTIKTFRDTFIRGTENNLIKSELAILRQFDTLYVKYDIPYEPLWVSKSNKLTISDGNFIDFEEYAEFKFFNQIEARLELGSFDEKIAEYKENLPLLKNSFLVYLNESLDDLNLISFLKENTPIKSLRISSNINLFIKEDTILIENIYVEFLVENDWLPWSYLSDGTKRLFYLISECISTKQGIILIEEPELGIHPHQFYKVLDFLHEQAQTKQVIISTHSPMALDILKPDELDRITIAKYDKGTKFLKLTKKQIAKAKRYMKEVDKLSDYWLHSDLEND